MRVCREAGTTCSTRPSRARLSLRNPQSKAIGYVLLATQMFRLGEQHSWAFECKLNANTAHWTASPKLVVTLVELGEAAVGAARLSDVLYATLGRKQLTDLVVPRRTAVIVHAAGIISGGPNPDGARRYIDFLPSDFAQAANT